MLYSIYFSPTGGTEKVTKLLSSTWKETKDLDISDLHFNYEDVNIKPEDMCIISVPSFGGRIPTVAVDRINKIKGNGAKAVAVVVYGNRDYDDTLLELKNVLEENGFVVGAMVAAIAEHSIARNLAAGRPDKSDEEELKKFSEEIKAKFESGEINTELMPKGNIPYKEWKGSALKPEANENCVECGLCAKKCPVGAIPMDKPKTVDKDVCMACMRCISVCPTGARILDETMKAGLVEKLTTMCKERKENELMI